MNITRILHHLFAALANAVNACQRTRDMLAAAIARLSMVLA